MKRHVLIHLAAFFITLASGVVHSSAEQPNPHQLGILDEKVSRLIAQMEDVQFRQQQMQKDIDGIRTELQEVRRAAGGASPNDLRALEDRIQAVDAARQADKKAIIDQLAKELSSLSSGRTVSKPASDSKEHIVQKGETLSAIAKTYSVSVTELKKVNGLTGDDIKIGQKLTIPK